MLGLKRLAALPALLLLIGPLVAVAQLETRSQNPTTLYPNSVVVADFNHDGKMDFAVASYYNYTSTPGIQIFLGNGDGTFGGPRAYHIAHGAGPLAVGDLNHDGNQDIVAISANAVNVLLGNGDGTFQAPVSYTAELGLTAVVLGDFNGDGNIDIAVSQYSGLAVLLGNGDGTFQPAINTALRSGGPAVLAAGYFSQSKNLDLAATTNDYSVGEVLVLLGNGDGTFTPGKTYTVAPNPLSIVAADLRNNGKTDLAVGEFEGMGVAVLLGNGDGTFQQPVVYGVPVANGVAVADINGDGIPDLVAAYVGNTSGLVGVSLGNGDGTFQNVQLYPAGQFPNGVAVADFNNDGMTDILMENQEGTRQEYVLLNTGTVAFSPTTSLNFGNQLHGTSSAPKTVTLANTGKNVLTVSSMQISAQYGMTSTCGMSVPAGGKCTINVTFSPSSKGSKPGTVSINDSAASKPQVIALTGTGT